MAQPVGRAQDLPDFRKPPLTETVLSLQFEPIEGLTTAHLGLLWQRFREQLPLVEEHPPLQPVLETFGPSVPAPVAITIEQRPPAFRFWFLSEAKTELVQVQVDRFIHNWRKVQGTEPYPRYEPIRDKFRGEVAALAQFLKDEQLGTLVVNQCEVSYINHIEPSGMWERHGQLERVLRNWSRLPASACLAEAEDGGVRLRFVIPGEDGTPIGRLHVVVQPAWKRADNSPILVMALTARGAPLGEGIEDTFTFFDVGRRWIVKGFADLTTPEMHQAWERIDV